MKKANKKTPEIMSELDHDKKIHIDIISKAFNMPPKEFIDFVLIKEINYIKSLLDFSNPKDELERLILIEEVI